MTTPEAPPDFRLEYIGGFVQKSLKLKPEKWGRLLLTEEYRNVVLDFLDKPWPVALFVVLTPNAQLVASSSFPIPCQRTKGESLEAVSPCTIIKKKLRNFFHISRKSSCVRLLPFSHADKTALFAST